MKMPQRCFKGLVLTGLLAVLPAQTVIKMATLAPEGTDWHGMLVEMGQGWNQATEGEVVLRIYPGGVVGDERDMIRKMRIGQINAAAITSEGLSEINPDFTVYFIPLLYDNYDEVDYIHQSLFDQLSAGVEEGGFKLLLFTDVGWVYWFTSDTVVYPEDLMDRKIFTWAGDFKTADLWEKVGFSPVPLASIDILSGLQTGLIDAVSATPLYALAQQWFGITSHMLDMKWGLLTAGLVVDLRVWNRISPEHKSRMLAVTRDIGVEHQARNRAEVEIAIEVMQGHGLKVHRQSPQEYERWAELVKKWYPNIRGNIVSEAMFDKVMELKAAGKPPADPQ